MAAWSVPGCQRPHNPAILLKRIRISCMVSSSAWPICSCPVTLGGGITIVKGFCPDLLLHGSIRCPSIFCTDDPQYPWDHKSLQVLCSCFPPESFLGSSCLFWRALSDYGSFKMLLFSARKSTPSTPKLTTPVRRAIILAVPPSLSGKTILSVIPVYLLSLNAGYVKTYAATSVSVLIALPEIIAFSLPAPKLPSAVFHLKMPSSLRSFCVRASLSVSVFLHTPLIQRLYHVPTIMKFSFLSRRRPAFPGISHISLYAGLLLISVFYSTLFSDSTMSIFFSLKCITIFTNMENPKVMSPL